MLQSLMPLIVLMSWLALPVTLICIVDDWFLRPRRALAAAGAAGGARRHAHDAALHARCRC